MRIDVNTSLGHWPFMRFEQDSPTALASHLASEGIDLALVSSIETALFPDPDMPDRELAKALAACDTLLHLPTIDPTLGHWRSCLAAHRAESRLNAVRIMPNYHRYDLGAACVEELAETLLAGASPVLVVQMRLEDERNQYPLMQIPGVPYTDIIAFAQRREDLPILCLCPYRGEAAALVQETRNVFVDTAFVEHLDSLETLLAEVPVERVLFGSHTPVLYTRANVMKLECANIAESSRIAIAGGNAARLFELAEPTT